mmetsp:Transcript_69915/g.193320  ORF Transcript_69915/g.193320 Transcript_69915/m.193320 type:complete len:305 (-) Transcript_69915:815-1729(-)
MPLNTLVWQRSALTSLHSELHLPDVPSKFRCHPLEVVPVPDAIDLNDVIIHLHLEWRPAPLVPLIHAPAFRDSFNDEARDAVARDKYDVDAKSLARSRLELHIEAEEPVITSGSTIAVSDRDRCRVLRQSTVLSAARKDASRQTRHGRSTWGTARIAHLLLPTASTASVAGAGRQSCAQQRMGHRRRALAGRPRGTNGTTARGSASASGCVGNGSCGCSPDAWSEGRPDCISGTPDRWSWRDAHQSKVGPLAKDCDVHLTLGAQLIHHPLELRRDAIHVDYAVTRTYTVLFLASAVPLIDNLTL